MAKKDKKKKGKIKKVKAKGLTWKNRLFIIALCLVALAFLPTSMLLVIGMFPSFVAILTSAGGRGARASTVAAMNVAGCVPFVFKLWDSGNDFATSFDIVSNSKYISIMYVSAAFGYMIDWVVTGLVSSFLYQKGLGRMTAIKKRQDALVAHWGGAVSGGLVKDDG